MNARETGRVLEFPTPEPEDDFRPARGIGFALLISWPFWMAAVWAVDPLWGLWMAAPPLALGVWRLICRLTDF